ncbi:MAG: HNH endonuclease [Lachnospiraceae bacterium]|nr:HNH endonuclease [Lachnospiraceae bacterium]
MTEWILPYNERGKDAFRVNDALRNLGRIEWVQNINLTNINTGDIVYLYEAAPVKAIRWKCKVTDVRREDSIIDDSAYCDSGITYDGPFIELEPLCEYFLLQQLSLNNLRKNGYYGNMQGSCRIERFKPELSEYIHKIDKIQTSDEELTKVIQKISMQELEKLARSSSKRNPEVREIKTKQYNRSVFVSAYTKRRAGKYCELCGEMAPFLDKDGNPYLEIHHVVWLSNGGEDSINNTVALCPNCHKKMHIVQESKDVHFLQKILDYKG